MKAQKVTADVTKQKCNSFKKIKRVDKIIVIHVFCFHLLILALPLEIPLAMRPRLIVTISAALAGQLRRSIVDAAPSARKRNIWTYYDGSLKSKKAEISCCLLRKFSDEETFVSLVRTTTQTHEYT